jgi:hypothetical protein
MANSMALLISAMLDPPALMNDPQIPEKWILVLLKKILTEKKLLFKEMAKKK